MPNELTPASRCRSGPGQPAVRSWTRSPRRSSGIRGFGLLKFRLGGSSPCPMLSTVLISPTIPPAPSRCPMFVLTEPTRSGAPAARPAPATAPSAAASTGSPVGVPLPCSSTYWTSAGDTSAARYASRSTFSWAAALGTVSASVLPSLLTALPRITQYTGSPSRSASVSGLSRTAPPPSPRTKPSARASKVWQRPWAERAPSWAVSSMLSSASMRLTPAASASAHSPRRRLSQARCTATREDDWAVSTCRLGPFRP